MDTRGEAARIFAVHWGGLMLTVGRITIRSLSLRPQMRLLDLGGGSGALAGEVASSHGVEAVTADKSEHMSRLCSSRVGCCVAAAEELPFRPGCFNAVVLNLVVPYLTSSRTAFAEVRRVLAPAGMVACSDWSRREWPTAIDSWREVAGPHGWQDTVRENRVNRIAGASLRAGLAAAEFSEVNVSECEYEYDWTAAGFIAARLASSAGREFVRQTPHVLVMRAVEEFVQRAGQDQADQYVERGRIVVSTARRPRTRATPSRVGVRRISVER